MGLNTLIKGSKRGVAAWSFLIVAVLLTSCSTTKEMRRANRASKKLEKLTIRFPELLRADTLRDTVPAIVTNIKTDTTYILQNKVDTLYLEKNRLRVRTIFKHDTIIQEAEYLGDTIYVPVEIPVEKIQPVQYKPMPLKWWQIALMFLGGGFIIGIFYRLTS